MKHYYPTKQLLLLAAFLLSNAALLFCQPMRIEEPPFEVTATFVEKAPKIDGKLDEEIWKTAFPISNFTQLWPQEGSSATENTEVRVAYDRRYLYFAFKCHDKNPELIRAMNLERGGRNDRDDHAYIGLDTYLDKRNAYLFEMNALGTQDDATITDEKLSIDGFSWDAVFDSETVINDEGWTMEVSIPFRQLRFPKGDDLSFGLMLSRMINRKNERVIWPDIGLEYGSAAAGFPAIAAISQYGIVKGLKNIRRGKNIEIKPYVIFGADKVRPTLSERQTDNGFNMDAGVDFKYSIASNLTLDMTVNTDFAQVEADNVQVNLTRFSLFFPEKREFFLERSGLFEHGNSRSTQTFFSRRIGLTNQILAGARMTGQIGNLSVGLLNIETGEEMGEIFGDRSANNTVTRLRTKLFKRSTIGGIFTNFQTKDRYNRALGFDMQHRFWSSSAFNTWFTKVWDNNPENADAAGHVSLSLRNDLYGARFAYTNVGANYNPALGFVRRLDMRQYRSGLTYSPVIKDKSFAVRRFTFQSDYDYIEGQDKDKQSTQFQLLGRAEFEKRDLITMTYQNQFERLRVPFNIRPDAVIPVGDYNFSRFSISGSTDQSRRTFAGANFSTGGFFNGNRTAFGLTLGYRQSKHLAVEASLNTSLIDLPIDNGEFSATILSTSILGAVNKDLFAKALIQYDNFTRNLQANIRVDWIHTPGSDLFLVYNTSYHFVGEQDVIFDPRRNVVMNNTVGIVKLTYLILL
ncbi:MAG: DUF5916 domain-containing protein [Bacteroidota bacterium]